MKKNRLPYQKASGFKTPEGYFESLESRVMESVAKEKTLSPAQQAFAVPGDYFDKFEDRLFKKMEAQPSSPKVRRLSARESFYYVAGIAAVFIAVVTMVFSAPPRAEGIESVDINSLEGYLHEVWETPSSNLPEIVKEEESLGNETQANFDQEALLEYLNENIEEPALIYYKD